MAGVSRQPESERLVCLGPTVSGLVISVDQYPAADGGAFSSAREPYLGADAVMVAQCLAGWGHRTQLITNDIGDDTAGNAARLALDAAGVMHHLGLRRDLPTPHEVDICDAAGTRTWFVDQRWDVFNTIRDASLTPIGGAALLYIDWYAELDTVKRARTIAAQHAVPVYLNVEVSATVRQHLPLLQGVAVAQTWAAAGGSASEAEMTARAMHEAGAGLAIVTRGPQGCIAVDAQGVHQAAAIAVAVRGTLGAGAVFSAAAIHAWLQRWPTPRLLTFAARAASLSCTNVGPVAPALDEL